MTKRAMPVSLSSPRLSDEQQRTTMIADSPNSSADLITGNNSNIGKPGSQHFPEHHQSIHVSSSLDPDTSSTSRNFRKRSSFGTLDHYLSSTSPASVSTKDEETSRKSSTRSTMPPTMNPSSSSISLSSYHRKHNNSNSNAVADSPLYFTKQRWARRKHPVIAVTAIFFAFWVCWTVIFTLMQFQATVDPLTMLMNSDGPSKTSGKSIPATLDGTRSAASSSILSASSPTRSLTAPLIRGGSTHSIPLPLPRQKVSVVLMNFSRPRMIRESSMMRTLLSHPNIDEVLLLHANPKTAFEFVHPKVTNIDAVETNNELGLSLRFFYCQVAKNEWVLHLDDDMEFTTEALNELLIEYERNPKRIVGRFGRDMTPGNSFNGYNSQNRHKSTEVVLTKLMMMERDLCSAFFEYAHLVWNDVILHNGEGPLWNGEDIFMSLVANHVYGPPKDGASKYNNYAMDWLEVWQADDSLKDYDNGKYDISGGMKGIQFWNWRWWQTVLKRNRHYSYRGHLWKIARERLKELK
jgi:Glycosyl transferase family 64 domain